MFIIFEDTIQTRKTLEYKTKIQFQTYMSSTYNRALAIVIISYIALCLTAWNN